MASIQIDGKLLSDTVRLQQRASSPDASFCVSASAGSGKTKVLVDRILRLMLCGAPIDTILCITFTNSATNEMVERLRKKLLLWFLNDDQANVQEILELTGSTPSSYTLSKMRYLYVEFCNKSTQIRIQTIHSFCKYVLEFLERERGYFYGASCYDVEERILDDARKKPLLTDAFNSVLYVKDECIKKYLDILISHDYDYDKILNLLYEVFTKPMNVGKYVAQMNQITKQCSNQEYTKEHCNTCNTVDYHALYAAVFGEWGIENVHSSEMIVQNYLTQLDYPRLMSVVRVIRNTNFQLADRITEWLNYTIEEKITNFEFFKLLFLTKDNTPRVKALCGISHAIWKSPECVQMREFLLEEQRKIFDIQKTLICYESASLNGAFRVILAATHQFYASLKERNNYLEYDDLIQQVVQLLHSSRNSSDLLYRLNLKIDHILIDEAQDLSTSHWSIITALVEEFYSGSSDKKGLGRTLFVVGDFKQSIYGFQGAMPHMFSEMMESYKNKFAAAKKTWELLSINACFRCAPRIIALVNHFVSANDFSYNAKSSISNTGLQHKALNVVKEGIVEVWKCDVTAGRSNLDNIVAEEVSTCNVTNGEMDSGDIKQLIHAVSEGDTSNSLLLDWCNNIAFTHDGVLNKRDTSKDMQIALYIMRKIIAKVEDDCVKPGDIMVLFRKRCETQRHLVNLLRKHNFVVQDMTCDNIMSCIYMQDLIAIGKFAVCPYDEMNLAIVLKGPIFNITDDVLQSFASCRQSNLLASVQNNQPEIYTILQSIILAYQSHFRCSDFYSSLFSCNSVLYMKFCAGHMEHALRVLENFWHVVEIFEKEEPYSTLRDFTIWCDSDQVSSISKKIPISKNFDTCSIKVTTIHGAKGMESPIVILADAARSEDHSHDHVMWDTDYAPIIGKRKDCPMYNTAVRNIYDEYNSACKAENMRLLYVAITRAKEELYIVGEQKNRQQQKFSNRSADTHTTENWYNMLEKLISDMQI